MIARTVRPGERVQLEVVVKNQTQRAFSFTAASGDLAERRAGARAAEPADRGSTRRSAGRWIRPVPDSWELAARTQRPVRLDVVVPEDAAPGGRYATVTIQAVPTTGDGAVQIRTEIPVIVLLTVDGPYRRALDVELAGAAGWDWTGGARTWRVRVRNDGDVHENLTGDLRIDPAIGAVRRIRLPAGVLLPDEARTYRVPVDVRAAPDLIRSRATIQRDRAPDVRSDVARTVVLPWWVVVALALVVLIASARIHARRRRSAGDDEQHTDDHRIDPDEPADRPI